MIGLKTRRHLARLMNRPFWRFRFWWPFVAYFPTAWAYRLARWTACLDMYDEHSETARLLQGMALNLPKILPDHTTTLSALMRRAAQEIAYDQLDAYTMDHWAREQANGSFVHWRLRHKEVLDAAIQAAHQRGGGVILVIAHHGRFFQFGPSLGLSGYPFSMLTTPISATNPAYKNNTIRRYWKCKLATTLSYAKGQLVSTQDSLRTAYRILQKGQILLVALDGSETNATERLRINTWGGVLHMPVGIQRIARYTGSCLVYGRVRTIADGVLDIELKSMLEDREASMTQALNYFREDIEQYPELWWQWPSLPVFWQEG